MIKKRDHLSECHGHTLMDGKEYAAARKRHENGVNEEAVREELAALRDAGVTYFRDGGDALGVSLFARSVAEEYGITYVSPAFAIHREGRYGGIVGRGYRDLSEFRHLVEEAQREGADFIKIMISGIITFETYGGLSCESLPKEEITEIIGIAHGYGFPVMLHINGADAVRAAIRAGAESLEHGYFMDRECLDMLSETETVWVPTLAATHAFALRPGFCENGIAGQTVEQQIEDISYAASLGAHIAAGSDAGAVGVPHGDGILTEYRLLGSAGMTEDAIEDGNARIRKAFHPVK